MVKNRTFSVRHVARTTSTQDVVRQAARTGAPDGFCCRADEQTAGRGRQGRVWVAPPGTALLASVLLRIAPAALPGIPFAAGLAVLDALAAAGSVGARLKWPNDVLVDGRKLAGLLVEVEPGSDDDLAAAVVGLGVNLSVEAFPDGVSGISLHALIPAVPEAGALLEGWLHALDAWVGRLERDGVAPVLEAWRAGAVGLGEPVTVVTGDAAVDGIAAGVAEDGALLVRSGGRTVRVLAGDVHLLSGPR